jgi:enamine deaminase RidA (YjgF/YER057c/UK114 family)
MDVGARLNEMGLTLPGAAAPVAAYLPFLRVGELLHVSGQISRDAAGAVIRGRLGQDMDVAAGAAAAQSCALQILAQIGAACEGDWRRLARLVKLTGFVASAPHFEDHPKVVNGASDLFVALFGEAGRHARSAIGVAALPLGAAVEIEAVALLR